MPIGCATVIAAWILHLQGHGAPVKDPAAGAARAAAAEPDVTAAIKGVLGTSDPELPDDDDLVEAIHACVEVLTNSS
jgi:fructuronate reductase